MERRLLAAGDGEEKDYVWLPRRVYDLWMPIIGYKAVALYGAYCYLAENGSIKGVSQGKLARSCRMGINLLRDINDLLEELGFIKLIPPSPSGKLEHETMEILVFEAPEEIPREHLASGGVYLMSGENGLYKIGHSKKPQRRLREIVSSDEREEAIALICVIRTNDRWSLEAELHERFADKRCNGEWFKLGQEDVDYIVSISESGVTE